MFQIPPGENNIARPTIKALVLTDHNHTLKEVCHWIDSFDCFSSCFGIFNNPQELFLTLNCCCLVRPFKILSLPKPKCWEMTSPLVVRFHNIVTEWKRPRGFCPFQAEHVHEEMKNIRTKPDNMSIKNAFAAHIKDITDIYPSYGSNHQIPQDEIITIMKHCNSNHYHKLVEKDVQTQEHPGLRQIVKYYMKIEDLEKAYH
jgi:hypothetical protein